MINSEFRTNTCCRRSWGVVIHCANTGWGTS
uniref:Uncharacterized protein n=1 Tax=Anguilla anguilla TaxID=7936 RepID=A0A0E9V3S7_ANGAN